MHESIYFPQGFKVKDSKVFLPKIGWIRFFKSRDIQGTIKNVTITSGGIDNWFASFCTQEERSILDRPAGEVGLDLGITTYHSNKPRRID